MSKFVFSNGFVSVDGVDLSDHVASVEVRMNADQVEQTAMGDAAHNFQGGLKDQGISLTFKQDFVASKVDATLAPLLGAAAVAVVVRPVNTAVSAINPSYSGNMMLSEYTPIQGSVGDSAEAPAQFVPGDGSGIVRATS